MRLEIEHRTRFSYSRPIFLEPHILRLTPRSDLTQVLESFTLEISPQPAGVCANDDLDGDATHHLWFTGETEFLEITARSVVRSLRENPFDYLLHPGNQCLPIPYAPLVRRRLQPYLAAEPLHHTVEQFAGDLLVRSGGATQPFLLALNEQLWRGFARLHRDHGHAWEPEETLRRREGACRDLSVLFIAVCRYAGLAARFTSGYFFIPESEECSELHAWPEVYLPGAGWRGFDPTHGLAVGPQHVCVASGPHAVDTLPVEGTFRGTGAMHEMTPVVKLRRLGDSPEQQQQQQQ